MADKDTTILVNEWKTSLQAVADAEAAVNRAETRLKIAEIALGKRLVPDDATEGERFNIWIDDKMIQVTLTHRRGDSREYLIRWR